MFVITGGGSGIGGALAQELANRGHAVLIVGRNESNLADVAFMHKNIKYFCADVSSQEGRVSIKEYLQDKKIQALINNAGIIQPIANIFEISLEDWHKVMATNLDAPLFLTKLLRTNLSAGRVLNIGSGAAHFSVLGWSAYCVSKAALFRLTECLQLEEENIAFTSVMPGIIDTNMQKEIRETINMAEEKQKFFHDLYAENKLIKPEVVAAFLAWLLLDIDAQKFESQEWDIYDKVHHAKWLQSCHDVPGIE